MTHVSISFKFQINNKLTFLTRRFISHFFVFNLYQTTQYCSMYSYIWFSFLYTWYTTRAMYKYIMCEGRCDSKVMLSLHDTIKFTFLNLKITKITFPLCTCNETIYTENPLTLFDSFCNTVTTHLPE